MTLTRPPAIRLLAVLCLLAAAGCAVKDAYIARDARTRLLGLKEVDLVACLGGPDEHISYPGTNVLTWYATSSSSINLSPPIIGGFSANNGGYCHVTVRIDGGVVSHVIYSGEKNATFAPDAYCAPILRSCIAELAAKPRPAQAVPR